MMFKIAEEDKRVLQRREGELEKLWNDSPKNQLFHLLHSPPHHQLVNGSPVSRASEFSPSSSLSNGFYSSEDGSPYAPPFEEGKHQTHQTHQTPYVGSGLWWDPKAPDFSHVGDDDDYDLGLAENFCRMHIGDERRGLGRCPDGFGFNGGGGFLGGVTNPWSVESYGLLESSKNNVSVLEAFQPSGYGVRGRFDVATESALLGLQPRCGVGDSMGPWLNHMQPNNALYSGPSGVKNQMSNMPGQRKDQGDVYYGRSPCIGRPYLDDEFFCLQLHGTDSNGRGKGLMYPIGSPQFPAVSHLNVDNLSHNHSMTKQRIKVNPASGVPESFQPMQCGDLEDFSCEDSFIIQGKHLNHAIGKSGKSSKGYKKGSCNKITMQAEGEKSLRLDPSLCNGGQTVNECGQRNTSSLRPLLNISSLVEVQGHMYFLAKDQYGCRFLQRMLDEGTCQDVQLIFDRVVDYVFELMTNPFGNYLMQKLIDVCNEQQRMQFVLKVTKEPGQLVRISLDTHGTRVVQKLIETVKTGKQISLVKSSLECGFLDLIKDPNGNHVVQRCLDCFSNEDNRFVYDAAARFCVEIATQRHGCCVLQKCIAHASGRNRDKLINEIARNGLLLSQDPYGNYVVQYVMELRITSAMAKLINQLKGHFVRLSTQKCSSHVVEKCLKYFEESRSKIIHELLSVPRFEQLLQDPYANYVIQAALTVTKGPLHASLVEAVKPHTILRTSPYCKRIFSRELLKK